MKQKNQFASMKHNYDTLGKASIRRILILVSENFLQGKVLSGGLG
jgi:hypothetical protein